MIRALGVLIFLLSFVLSSTENLFSQNLDKEELRTRCLNSGRYSADQESNISQFIKERQEMVELQNAWTGEGKKRSG